MRTDLWWRNLVDRKMRLFLRVAAITFPIMLIFVQIGFYGAVLNTATVIQESLNADLFLVSSAYINISRAGTFPRARLYQAASVAGVERVAPLYVGHRAYQNPTTLVRHELLVFGIDPEERTFRLPEVSDRLRALTVPDTVLIDRNSRPEFGPQQSGTTTQVERKRVEIVGQYTIGTGFAALGDLITTDLTFSRIFDGRTLERVSVGLVQATPGSDVRGNRRAYSRAPAAGHSGTDASRNVRSGGEVLAENHVDRRDFRPGHRRGVRGGVPHSVSGAVVRYRPPAVRVRDSQGARL